MTTIKVIDIKSGAIYFFNENDMKKFNTNNKYQKYDDYLLNLNNKDIIINDNNTKNKKTNRKKKNDDINL